MSLIDRLRNERDGDGCCPADIAMDAADEIESLTLKLDAERKLATGYYGEAQEGWGKFRVAESRIKDLECRLDSYRQAIVALLKHEDHYDGPDADCEACAAQIRAETLIRDVCGVPDGGISWQQLCTYLPGHYGKHSWEH